MKSRMGKICRGAWLSSLTAALLAGCGGGGGGGPTAVLSSTQEKGVFTGFTGNLDWEGGADGTGGAGIGGGADGDGGVGVGGALGQFRRALVIAKFPDGSELGRAITDETLGMVTIRPGRDYTGALLIEIHGQPGAEYFEEGKNRYVPFEPGRVVRAYVPQVNRNIGLTPFSEAAVRLADACRDGSGPAAVCAGAAGANGVLPSTAAIHAANQQVRTLLNEQVPTALGVDDVTRLPFIVGDATGSDAVSTTPRGRYGLVNAAFSKQAAMFNTANATPTLLAIEQLGRDLLDGRLDGRSNGAPAAAAGLRTYDPGTLTTELSSSLAQQTTVYGDLTARSSLPRIVSFGNTRYDSYFFDATVTPSGNTQTIAVATETTSTRRTPGQVTEYVTPNGPQRGFTVYGNMGSGALFIKTDSADSTSQVLVVGDNTNGELGDGSRNPTIGGARTITLPGVLTHAAGGIGHTVARLADGSVLAWGDNAYSQLGQGPAGSSLPRSTTPVRVPLAAGAIAVAASNTASFALLEDGALVSWGSAWDFGTLGDGTRSGVRTTPAPVLTASGPLTGVVQVAARDNDAVALTADGRVWTWGSFPPPASPSPSGFAGGQAFATPVAGLPASGRIRKVLTEQGLFAALVGGGPEDGAVYTWGVHFDITAGTVLYDLAPVRVLNLPPVRDLMPGGFLGYGQRPSDRLTALAIDYDGGLWKIRGRVAERYDPLNPTAQRRPPGEAPRTDCSSCHTVRPRTEPPLPTTGPACVLPAFKLDGAGQPLLVNSRSSCQGCHNGNPLGDGRPLPALTCVPQPLPDPRPPTTVNPATTGCQIPAGHPAVPAGATCSTCHNSVIASPLTCSPTLQPPPRPPLTTADVTGATDNAGQQVGPIGNGGTTDDATPTFTGTLSAALAAGESVRILRDGVDVGVGAAGAGATAFSFASPALPDGRYTFTAQVLGPGGRSTAGAGFTLTVATPDTVPPIARPTIVQVRAAVPVSAQVPRAFGAIPSGAGIHDNRPTIVVRVAATLPTDERRVQLFRAGPNGATIPASQPTLLREVSPNLWEATFQDTLPVDLSPNATIVAAQQFTYTARVVDNANNLGPASIGHAVRIGWFDCFTLLAARQSLHSGDANNTYRNRAADGTGCTGSGCHGSAGASTWLSVPPSPSASTPVAYRCTLQTNLAAPLRP